jgi:hypothetical protein
MMVAPGHETDANGPVKIQSWALYTVVSKCFIFYIVHNRYEQS